MLLPHARPAIAPIACDPCGFARRPSDRCDVPPPVRSIPFLPELMRSRDGRTPRGFMRRIPTQLAGPDFLEASVPV
jgi:hypothetical protein